MTNSDVKILIVDDVESNRFVLRNIITDMGYNPILCENGIQALKAVSVVKPSLILLDISMPNMDGFEVCAHLKRDPQTKDIPVIFISAYDDNDDIIKGFNMGCEDYIIKPFVKEVIESRVNVRLKLFETTEKMEKLNHQLVTLVNQQNDRIWQEKKMVLYALANVARQNSEYGEAYMDRISENSGVLATALQLSPLFEDKISDNFIEAIRLAAPLCDLGNVAISESILQKKGSLDAHETIEMQKHTLIGEKILSDIDDDGYENEFLSYAIEICKCHHENWDGTGYPSNIAGYAIPLSAQIVRVSNVYTALTENRVYRGAYSPQEALEIMESGSGTKFNSDIFDICKKIYKQLK